MLIRLVYLGDYFGERSHFSSFLKEDTYVTMERLYRSYKKERISDAPFKFSNNFRVLFILLVYVSIKCPHHAKFGGFFVIGRYLNDCSLRALHRL